MELKTYFAQDASGNIMPGATVMVYEAATTTLATGLQDESGSPLANPFTADSSAKVAFYAPDGLYDITVVGNGRTVTIRAQFVSVDGASVLRGDLAAPGGSALVGVTPSGGISAATVQAALEELDTEKASLSGALFTGPITYNGIAGVFGNTGYGHESLNSVTAIAGSNTALGHQSMKDMTTGDDNTAVGFHCMIYNKTGHSNTAVGSASMAFIDSGYDNVAVGMQSLYTTSTGYANTATGNRALLDNTLGYRNTATGVDALRFNIDGLRNTAVGVDSMRTNTTGSNNVAVGVSSMLTSTVGNNNTAVGYESLRVNTATGNTAVGSGAGYSNTSGTKVAALGVDALRFNTTGAGNVAVGVDAQRTNTTGSNNTAIGTSALLLNSVGLGNTAVGFESLRSTTGSHNTGIGRAALYANTSGQHNVAIGYQALKDLTAGSGNTVINPLTGGGAYAPVFNPTTEDNRVALGSTATTNAYVNVAWTVVSDARDKTNFGEVPHGLDFVKALKPISYQFRVSRESDVANGPVRYGFKAQEVLALEGDSPVIVDNEDQDKLRMVDAAMIPVLVRAIQELTARIEVLEARVA